MDLKDLCRHDRGIKPLEYLPDAEYMDWLEEKIKVGMQLHNGYFQIIWSIVQEKGQSFLVDKFWLDRYSPLKSKLSMRKTVDGMQLESK